MADTIADGNVAQPYSYFINFVNRPGWVPEQFADNYFMQYRANITYNKSRNAAGIAMLKFLNKNHIKTLASFNNIKPGQKLLEDLYKEYGYHQEGLVNIGLAGEEGAKKIGRILNHFRVNNPAGFDIVAKEDYELRKRYDYASGKESDLTLPVSNVIKFFLKDGSWFVLRPSGTEPKMKVYIACVAPSIDEAKAKVKKIEDKVMKIVGDID